MADDRVLYDTNLYIDWINRRAREELMVGRGFVRYLSAIVYLELLTGAASQAARRSVATLLRAHEAGGRFCLPGRDVFERAGRLLPVLRREGLDVRRAALVNDVLIALTARSIGATVYTLDRDFEVIRRYEDFSLQVLTTAS